MIRRTLIGGVIGLLAMGLVFGRDAFNFAKTSAGWVRSTIDESVPVELKIEQARVMIKQLEPEVRRNKHLIVREEVALERLSDQIAKLDSKQETEQANLLRMRNEVESGKEYVHFAGHRYSCAHVKQDMANRFERYKTNDETLFNLRRAYNTRQQRLESARGEVEQMLASRRQLMADVEKLEARQKMATVAQTSSEFNLDNSILARANQLVRDVETRLDVTERMLDSEIQFAEEIPLETPGAVDVSEQIAEYFGPQGPQVEEIAAEITSDFQLQ